MYFWLVVWFTTLKRDDNPLVSNLWRTHLVLIDILGVINSDE